LFSALDLPVCGLPQAKLNEIGARPGEVQQADFVVIDLSDLALIPPDRLESHMVYSMSDRAIRHVFVHDKPAVTDGKLCGMEEAALRARVVGKYRPYFESLAMCLAGCTGCPGAAGTARRGVWPWIEQASRQLHRNMLATALANKLARIAWAVLARGHP
jgi:hypothetical protein